MGVDEVEAGTPPIGLEEQVAIHLISLQVSSLSLPAGVEQIWMIYNGLIHWHRIYKYFTSDFGYTN